MQKIKEFFKPKRYNFFVKLIAIGIFLFMLLIVMGFIIEIKETNEFMLNDNYYKWEITGDTVENSGNGTYKVTLDLKNVSAYECCVDKYSIRFEYGTNGTLDNITPPYPESAMYDTLNEVFLPAGQSIKYTVTLAPPEGVNSVIARYMGESYRLRDSYGDDYDPYSYYTIKF